MWKQVGINGRLELMEGAQKDAAFKSDTGDPDGYLWRNWGPDNAQQKNGWWAADSAAKYNALGKEARSILDRQRRYDLYQQMLDEYEGEAPGTTLYIPKVIYAMKNTIDWTLYPLHYMDLRAYNFTVK